MRKLIQASSLFILSLMIIVFQLSCSQESAKKKGEEKEYPEDIYLTANVALLMENSVSMATHDPKYYRIDAARYFVDLLDKNNSMSLIIWNHEQTFETDLFEPLSSPEVHEKITKALKAVKNQHAWKDICGVLETAKGLFDENFNRELLKRRQKMREEGIEPPKRRQIFVMFCDADRIIDIHQRDIRKKRFPDGTWDYLYNILTDIYASKKWQIYVIGFTKRGDHPYLRSLPIYTNGAFYPVTDREDMYRAFGEIAADIDGKLIMTETELDSDNSETTFPIPCPEVGLRLGLYQTKSNLKVEQVSVAPTSGTGRDLDLTEKENDSSVRIGKDYYALAPQPPACGKWTVKGRNVCVQALYPAPFIVKTPKLLNMYVAGDKVKLDVGLFDLNTKLSIKDPSILGKIKVAGKVETILTEDTGKRSKTERESNDVLFNNSGMGADEKASNHIWTAEFETPKKDCDVQFFFEVVYEFPSGEKGTFKFNRITRVSNAPRMVQDTENSPKVLKPDDEFYFTVYITQGGERITDAEILEDAKFEVTIQHLPTKKMIRNLDIYDAGSYGDKEEGDGVYTRAIKISKDFRRQGLKPKQMPGTYEFKIKGQVPHEGSVVTQFIEGSFNVVPGPR